ncbi:MAG TPA: energy transducer TonB [Deltaproteobacteria bacterium]|nr:energy transducer TonB [Deltaproteobacteria bacterium]
MQLLLSGLLVFAGTHALAGRTMISTSRPVGGISPAVVQMLGNRLQEIAIGEAELLSPRLLRPLELSGVESADPDDCDSERCDRILREHFQTLHTVHKASDLLLLQVVAEQETAQLRLKRVRVDEPMITTALATEVCVACEPPELLALLVPLFNQVWGAKLPEAPAVAEPEPLPPEPAPAPQEALAEDQPLPVQSVEEVTPEAPASDLAKELLEELEQGVTELPLDEEVSQEEYEVELRPAANTETLEKLFEPPPPDPYDVATAEYSQYLMTKLQDVSYTLQVYQTGMKVLVELEIGANGELLNQRLLESSGLEEFDQLALEQVEFMRFSPLPEPMVDYAPHVVHVYLQNSSL